jgi:hypothetical protein
MQGGRQRIRHERKIIQPVHNQGPEKSGHEKRLPSEAYPLPLVEQQLAKLSPGLFT